MILLKNIGKHEFDLFHEMALEYFRELDNNFYPTDKWELFIESCIKIPKNINTVFLGVYLENKLIGFFILVITMIQLIEAFIYYFKNKHSKFFTRILHALYLLLIQRIIKMLIIYYM